MGMAIAKVSCVVTSYEESMFDASDAEHIWEFTRDMDNAKFYEASTWDGYSEGVVFSDTTLHEDDIDRLYKLLAHTSYTGNEIELDSEGRVIFPAEFADELGSADTENDTEEE